MAAIFNEVLLDPYYSAGARGGPTFSTAIVSCPSGFRQANVNRDDHIGQWVINYDLIADQAALDALREFFEAQKGMAYGFRFLAPEFNAIEDADAHQFAIGDGLTDTFNLYTRSVVGNRTHTHQITKPMAGSLSYVSGSNTIKIFVDGVEEEDVTVSSTTGAVVFDVAPDADAVLTWSGEFHAPVRFGQDEFEAQVDLGGTSVWGAKLIEMLPVELGL